jgi:hypothetical protein
MLRANLVSTLIATPAEVTSLRWLSPRRCERRAAHPAWRFADECDELVAWRKSLRGEKKHLHFASHHPLSSADVVEWIGIGTSCTRYYFYMSRNPARLFR